MPAKSETEKAPPASKTKAKKRIKPKLNVTRPDDTKHLNAILYGASGAGKTHLLGTAVECEATNPPLFLDFESGTRTLTGVDIDIIRPQSWQEIQDVYEFLLYDNTKYRSVMLDSLTEIQKKYSMGMIMGEMEDDRFVYTDLGRVEVPTRRDWSRTGDQMRKVIRSFRELAYVPDEDRRVHVMFTALEKYYEKKDRVSPSLTGALGEDCAAMVDFLLRLSRQNVLVGDADEEKRILRRYLLTDDHVNEDGTLYMGKNRGRDMPKGIWDPSMNKLINCIMTGGEGDE